MTSINDVRLVGRLVKDPEMLVTSGKKQFAKLSVETENFIRVNGERKRIAHVHTVVCFNQFSLPVLENHARAGTRVKVLGELAYDRNGKAEVRVLQYSGEVGLMDPVGHDEDAPASSPTQPPAKTTSTKPSGGLGRLPKSSAPAPSESSYGGESFSASDDDDEDDQIPF